MIARSSKFLLHMLAASLIGLVLLCAVTVWLLSRGPISVGFLTPYVEQALTVEDAPVRVRLGDTVLTWGGFDRTLDVRAVGLDVLDEHGTVLASVPEISVRFSARALLDGLIAPTSLELLGPRLRVVRGEDGVFQYDLSNDRNSDESRDAALSRIVDELLARPDQSRGTGYLTRIVITSALVEYEDRQSDIRLTAPRVNLAFDRDVEGIRASGSVAVDISGKPLRVQVSGILSARSRNTDLGLVFSEVEPATLAPLLPELGFLKEIDLPLNGTVALSLNSGFELEDVGFDIDSAGGAIALPALYADPVEVSNLALRGRARDGFRSIAVEEGTLELFGAPVSVVGTLVRRGRWLTTDFDARLRHVAVNDVERWWPEGVKREARTWVTQNLRDGEVESARINISGSMPLDDPSAFKVTDLDGRIAATNVTVHYLRPMDPVRGVNSVATFDLAGFVIDATAGEVRDMRVDSGRITIAGLDGAPTGHRINIELTVDGAVRGALELLDQKPLEFVRRLDVAPASASGHQRTQLIVQFPLLNRLTFDDVQVAAAARLSGFSLDRGPFGLPVSSGDLSLQIDPEKMIVDGNLALSGVPAGVAWTEWFTADTPNRRTYQVRAILNDEARGKLGLDLSPWLTGPVGIGLSYSEAAIGAVSAAAEIDLTSATMAVEDANWRKSAGIPGRAFLRFSGDRDEIRRFDRFSLTAADLAVEGNATLRPAPGGGIEPAQVTLNRLAFGGTDVVAAIDFAENGALDISIGGHKLDLRREVEAFGAERGQAAVSDRDATPIRIHISEAAPLGTVRLGEATVLSKVRGTILASGSHVSDAQLVGDLNGKGEVSVDIRPVEGGRQLNLLTNNGGELVSALDVTDTILGGRLELRGRFADDAEPVTFTGQVDLTDFHLTEASSIARALTLASFEGVSDTAGGRGLAIRRAEVPLTFSAAEIVITDAKLRGADVGVLATGRIDRRTDTIDLAGEVAPAYTLNSLLGNIPLIGQLLTGGGDGIFAASYNVRGPVDRPEVTVNPLTVLTPGIIRRLLTGFGSEQNQAVGKEEEDDLPTEVDNTPQLR